eukprot:3002254-Amphidinium_carterae.1
MYLFGFLEHGRNKCPSETPSAPIQKTDTQTGNGRCRRTTLFSNPDPIQIRRLLSPLCVDTTQGESVENGFASELQNMQGARVKARTELKA